MSEAKYINFIESSFKGKKTKRWFVSPKDGGGIIGEIRWFGRWFQYSFYPTGGTVFEKTCLRDIANFCENQTKAWRKSLNANHERAKGNE